MQLSLLTWTIQHRWYDRVTYRILLPCQLLIVAIVTVPPLLPPLPYALCHACTQLSVHGTWCRYMHSWIGVSVISLADGHARTGVANKSQLSSTLHSSLHLHLTCIHVHVAKSTIILYSWCSWWSNWTHSTCTCVLVVYEASLDVHKHYCTVWSI